MPIIFSGLYITACVVCGVMGRNTVFGFMGHFLLALFLTPMVDFVIQAVGRPSARLRDKILSLRSR
ncbi:hypothetical protein [Azospirillum sp.]|uniref:hypothetical protein n=1 Tax=Azospirillum sp. TaxID=34012 RepID=UPI0026182436|nr:hypothetical protein [Azospirillum sp.]